MGKNGIGTLNSNANQTSKHAVIRNGPNGISLFIVNPNTALREIGVGVNRSTNVFHCADDRRMSGTETTAPMMNAKNTANSQYRGPSRKPIPSASFASPNPIHVPRETTQSANSGDAATGPERTSHAKPDSPENGASS